MTCLCRCKSFTNEFSILIKLKAGKVLIILLEDGPGYLQMLNMSYWCSP